MRTSHHQLAPLFKNIIVLYLSCISGKMRSYYLFYLLRQFPKLFSHLFPYCSWSNLCLDNIITKHAPQRNCCAALLWSFLVSSAASRSLWLLQTQTLPPTCAFFPCRQLQALSSTATATSTPSQRQPPLPLTLPPGIEPLPPKMKTAARAPKRAKVKEVCVSFQ